MPSMSSDCTSVKRRASAASLRAYASAPTAVAWKRPEPGDHEAAREHLVADALSIGVGLAGEQRLVDLEAVADAHDAVGRDLVAGAQLEQVVEHHRPRPRSRRAAPSRTTRGSRRVEHREPVERALGPDLLDDADQRVGDEDDAEQSRPGSAPTDQDDDEHRAEDRVEPGEDVGPDDLAVGAARALAARRS